MIFKEYSAKTLDEAITKASVDLGVTSSELEYEVTEKGSGGFLGLGKKDVTIKACKKSDYLKEKAETEVKVEKIVEEEKQSEAVAIIKEEATANITTEEEPNSKDKEQTKRPLAPVDADKVKAVAENFLKEVFDSMGLEVSLDVEFSDKDNSLSIDFSGENMGIIIGKRGQTLDSLQYLVNLVVNKNSDSYVRIKLDTEDYRKRRKDTLENLARNIAYKVRKTGKPVTLEAMNPYERRTIHYALQKDRYVTTYSEGEDPFRHVVVTLKK